MQIQSTLEALNTFDCTLSTSYSEWEQSIIPDMKKSMPFDAVMETGVIFDETCEKFAKAQKAFMFGPTSLFHDIVYTAKTVKLPTKEHLFAFSNSGPLYMVFKHLIYNFDAERTVECFYTDDHSFEKKYGLWYPKKEEYVLRYGVRI